MYELIRTHPGKNELEYKSAHGSTRNMLEADTPIYLDGIVTNIRDLKPGDQIELQSKVGKILKVVATRPKAGAAAKKPVLPVKKKAAPQKKVEPAAAVEPE